MFTRGTQVASVPDHVLPARDQSGQPDFSHPDVQFGFVTSGPNFAGGYFVRYWTKQGGDLRTKSCSESTPAKNLFEYRSHTDAEVDAMLERWC